MGVSDATKAGVALFIGAVQFGVSIVVSEAMYPGYSVSSNTLSDLGVPCPAGVACGSQNSWLLIDASIVLLGLLVLASAYYMQKYFKWKPASGVIAIAGIGLIGSGVFNETAPFSLHGIFSLLTFLAIGLSAVVTFWLQKPPMSYLSVILGLISLVALILYLPGTGADFGNLLGIGNGGLERLIVYPVLLWSIGFSGHLMALDDKA